MANLALVVDRSYNTERNIKALNDKQNVTHVIRLMIQKQNIIASGMEVQQLNEAIKLMNK